MAARKISVDNTTYMLQNREDGNQQLTRITPYDETNYHWALSSHGGIKWQIILDKKVVDTMYFAEPEDVARVCKAWDGETKRHRTGGIY